MSKIVNIDTVVKSFCEQCCECGHCSEECNDVAKLRKLSAEEEIATISDLAKLYTHVTDTRKELDTILCQITDLENLISSYRYRVDTLEMRVHSGQIPDMVLMHNDICRLNNELNVKYEEFKQFKEKIENS